MLQQAKKQHEAPALCKVAPSTPYMLVSKKNSPCESLISINQRFCSYQSIHSELKVLLLENKSVHSTLKYKPTEGQY